MLLSDQRHDSVHDSLGLHAWGGVNHFLVRVGARAIGYNVYDVRLCSQYISSTIQIAPYMSAMNLPTQNGQTR